jgi:pancreatic triacylglycerol lipase
MEKTIFVIFCVISSSLATPLNYQYDLMSDGNGNMHLISPNSQIEEIEPSFNAESDTTFLLFTRANRLQGQQITWTRDSIANSNFNPSHPVRILIHGFRSDRTSDALILPTAAYLQRGEYNVIW